MKSLNSLSQFVASFTRPHPARDWLLVFAVGLVVFVALVVFAVYVFIGIRSGRIVGTAEGEAPKLPHVSREEIQTTVERYEARKTIFEAGTYVVPDLDDPAR